VSLVGEHRDLTLRVDNFVTLLTLRRTWKTNGRALISLLERSDFRVLVRVGRFGAMEVFPKPNDLIRLFLPRW